MADSRFRSTRRLALRPWGAVVLAAAVGACAETPPQPPAPPGTTPAAEPGATSGGSAIQPGLSWTSAVSGSGISITLQDAGGAPLLRLACTRDPARMTVEVEAFRAVGSEERLSFGLDDEPFVFVADPTADRPAGVQAEAPIDPALLDRLRTATAVHAVYGAQTLGPHIPPDPETGERFAEACRQIRDGAAGRT